MTCPALPKSIWTHIRSFSGDTGYEPTPSAKLVKDLHFWDDHGDYNFPHCGRDGYASMVVFALHAHLKKISKYNMVCLGDHVYRTTLVNYLRFVHIDRDGYAIKASEPPQPHPC